MRVLGALLLVSVVAVAGPVYYTCDECGTKFERSGVVQWGWKTFCGESCKDRFAAHDRDRGWRCKICDVEVLAPRREYVTGNVRYIKLGEPTFSGYCKFCLNDIKNGRIDPDDPPFLSPRTGDTEQRVSRNPYAPREGVGEEKEEEGIDEDAHSGFGALGYVAGIVVAVGFVIRFALR